MTQTGIPYYFMRGGSSRGPFFLRSDLPTDLDDVARVLVAAVGSGHPLNIDGIGGGNAVTTKVAMLSASEDEWADIDYFFAQVSVEDRLVDFKPTCGNMMIAVGAAAIEMGLVTPGSDVTTLRIRAVNTGARVVATVQTPDGRISYQGNTRIDGVPGTAAPVGLHFTGVAGSSTGSLLPTGRAQDEVQGFAVSCVDFAMPMVIGRAVDFGISGHESREELDANTALFQQIESVRLEAAQLMGMGNCTESVTPKFGLVARAQHGGSLAARYFMPWTTHPTLAVTGSQCLSACALLSGTVVHGLMEQPTQSPATLVLEHPQGTMDVLMHFDTEPDLQPSGAAVIRTARKLAEGRVFVPSDVWSGH